MTTENSEGAGSVLRGDAGLTKVYTSEKGYPDDAAAQKAFHEAKRRMYDVNRWGKIPGPENATFVLYDQQGVAYATNELAREGFRLSAGCFIKTLLPGGLPENWVQITDVQEADDTASFTVRPCHDPTDRQSDVVTDHFFKSGATSTFKLERKGKVLAASEIGLNESINNQDPEAGNRKILNTLISEAGWAFVQKLQWTNVTDYIVGNVQAGKE